MLIFYNGLIQVIAVNGKFPGPVINVTTNENVVVNVRNKLDEDLLVTWYVSIDNVCWQGRRKTGKVDFLLVWIWFHRPGLHMLQTSWQDGVLGTNCPIPSKWNWTYQFQVKDQIGSFFYFPSLKMQRASGGFGSFIITNRPVISLPFNFPDGDIVIFIGDWYTRNHTVGISSSLDSNCTE